MTADTLKNTGRFLYQIYDNLDSRTRYMVDDVLYNTYLVGNILRARDNLEYYDAYLERHNMDWTDVKRHKVNLGVGEVANAGVSFVSSNLRKLYR